MSQQFGDSFSLELIDIQLISRYLLDGYILLTGYDQAKLICLIIGINIRPWVCGLITWWWHRFLHRLPLVWVFDRTYRIWYIVSEFESFHHWILDSLRSVLMIQNLVLLIIIRCQKTIQWLLFNKFIHFLNLISNNIIY